MPALSSLSVAANVAVIGASGGIGAEFVRQLSAVQHIAQVHAFSRTGTDFADDKVLSHTIDVTNDDSIRRAALTAMRTARREPGSSYPRKSRRASSAR